MDPTYGRMLTTAGQLGNAWLRATLETGQRTMAVMGEEASVFARLAARPMRADAELRQGATEDAMWEMYQQHRRMLRGATGIPALWAAVFLSHLDAARQPGRASAHVKEGAAKDGGAKAPAAD
jgi:hypothetical protein